jgi:hypothetical protein
VAGGLRDGDGTFRERAWRSKCHVVNQPQPLELRDLTVAWLMTVRLVSEVPSLHR